MTYHLLHIFLKLLSLLPWCILYALSDVFFYLLYYLVRYRRKIVRKNIIESFPEKDFSEIERIEKHFYRFFSDMILESCKMLTISSMEISQRMKFRNVEEVNTMLRKGRSIAIYLGHYGNWEWVSSMPLCLEKDMMAAQIYRKLSNKNVDRLMLKIRSRMGATCVEMRKTARFVNEIIGKREVCIIGFIADQAPKKRDTHHLLQFLNHKTPVQTGTEKVIKYYGFCAYFLDVRRIKRGCYEAEFIKMHEAPQALPDFELTDLYFKFLEKMIQRQPELYLWTHNRFRNAEKLI